MWKNGSVGKQAYLFEKAARRNHVATRPQQEIDGVACLIDSPVQILPLTAQTKS
jgi:hypothetical protein